MRCQGCNTLLNERELAHKNRITGEYDDLCHDCYDSYKKALSELIDDSGIIYKYNLSGIET